MKIGAPQGKKMILRKLRINVELPGRNTLRVYSSPDVWCWCSGGVDVSPDRESLLVGGGTMWCRVAEM